MSRISRQILIGALLLTFLTSACGRLTLSSPTPVWTVPPAGQPVFPTATMLALATPTGATVAAQIPVTGEDVVTLQCEFCVEEESHAVLIFPDFALFDVSSDLPVSCFTADVTGGKRILVCHGRQSTTFNLNICSDTSDCQQFPVALQPCPLLQAGATPFVPLQLTPIRERTRTANTAVPSSTPREGTTPLPTSTELPPEPTATPPSSYGNAVHITQKQ